MLAAKRAVWSRGLFTNFAQHAHASVSSAVCGSHFPLLAGCHRWQVYEPSSAEGARGPLSVLLTVYGTVGGLGQNVRVRCSAVALRLRARRRISAGRLLTSVCTSSPDLLGSAPVQILCGSPSDCVRATWQCSPTATGRLSANTTTSTTSNSNSTTSRYAVMC